MALTFRALALAGAFAGTTLIAAPAAAAPMSSGLALGSASAAFDHSRFDPAGETADWRGCRWNCGWGGRRGWRRNRIDAGDVLIGAAVIGGLAAIISSNNRRERQRDVVIVDRDLRDRDVRDYRDPRRDDRRAAPRGASASGGASGLDNAVNQCRDRIERDVRIDTVDNVERTGAGWQVSGVLFNGAPFQCRIGNNGQIDRIDYSGAVAGNGFSSSATPDDYSQSPGQWDDQRYATARASVGGSLQPDFAVQEEAPQQRAQGRSSSATDRMPAYPGGPIPGEDIPDTIDADL